MARWASLSVTGSRQQKVGPANTGDARSGSESQTLAALGAASVDHGTAATGLHADEKAVGAGAADFGWLVSAFHDAQ